MFLIAAQAAVDILLYFLLYRRHTLLFLIAAQATVDTLSVINAFKSSLSPST